MADTKFSDPLFRGRAETLANELQFLLQENLLRNPDDTDEAMAQIQAIQKELQDMGLHVSWQAMFDPVNPVKSFRVVVTLWMPKPESSNVH